MLEEAGHLKLLSSTLSDDITSWCRCNSMNDLERRKASDRVCLSLSVTLATTKQELFHKQTHKRVVLCCVSPLW